MSKEEMREGFEAWHCEQYKTHGMTGAPTRDLHNGVYSEKYCLPKQQALWECWQETGGDVAKVEALKEEIERVELGKQAVVFLMLGDIFHGVDGPEVDDWDIQYDHKVCNALAQMSPGAQIPLFTRSDAGELERLRAELGECKGEYDRAVNKVDALQELSVTNILLDVVPGHDGMGHEVFAKSVAEVCEKLGDFAMQSEDIQQSLTDTERRLHEVADYCATVEQRNADLEKLIAEAHAWVDHNNFGGTDAYDLRDRLAAAIKTAGAANKESAQ